MRLHCPFFYINIAPLYVVSVWTGTHVGISIPSKFTNLNIVLSLEERAQKVDPSPGFSMPGFGLVD
jgi:hypothetical protein